VGASGGGEKTRNNKTKSENNECCWSFAQMASCPVLALAGHPLGNEIKIISGSQYLFILFFSVSFFFFQEKDFFYLAFFFPWFFLVFFLLEEK
jgi:hypothetical protein